jgi:hypothetical protein
VSRFAALAATHTSRVMRRERHRLGIVNAGCAERSGPRQRNSAAACAANLGRRGVDSRPDYRCREVRRAFPVALRAPDTAGRRLLIRQAALVCCA